jgi:hypothetical protein
MCRRYFKLSFDSFSILQWFLVVPIPGFYFFLHFSTNGPEMFGDILADVELQINWLCRGCQRLRHGSGVWTAGGIRAAPSCHHAHYTRVGTEGRERRRPRYYCSLLPFR